MAEQNDDKTRKEVIESSIEKEMQSSFIDYAMSVIVSRALPDARDGLKPAQRRTLYAMYMLGNTHDKPTKKSARVVGTVIGQYHPHGDIAAYETLVRMAQYFSMNHMLVEGQGNMGSIDGDPPAAQRYTEVRLRKIAEEMLEDIDKDSVDMIPNFDNTEKEPVVLPSKIPNLLVNGSSGIAVGVATNILPHNLSEVCDAINAYIDNRDMTSQDLLKYVKGPDFPTSGTVFYDSDLLQSYTAGRGSVTIRGKTRTEDGKKKQIVIEEIPYTVNKATLVATIAGLSKEKKIDGISGLRDESGKEGIRVVIELKGDANPDYVLNALYKHSQLQISMPVMNVAVIGNKLLNLNLREFIRIFVDHRLSVVKRRTKFDLGVASDRLHIVEGLVKAIENIDRVTSLIKSKKDVKEAREALMDMLSVTEKQAGAILDMKLSRLTGLESGELRGEGEKLRADIGSYSRILSDDKYVFDIIKKETSDIKNRYGVPRKTSIEQNTELVDLTREDIINDEDSVIILTRSSYMKRLPAKAYKLQERGGKGIITIDLKEGDSVKEIVYCRSKDYLLLLSNKGRAYWLKAWQVPEGTRYTGGKAAVNLVRLREGEGIGRIINTREFSSKHLTFVTVHGRIKRVRAESFSRPRSNGIKAIPLSEGDELAEVAISDGKSQLLISTRNGKIIRFNEEGIRSMSRVAAGVRGIKLSQNDTVASVISIKPGDSVLSITQNGYGKITPVEKYRLQKRGGRGVANLRVNSKTGEVIETLDISKASGVLLVNSKGLSIEIDTASIRVTGRNASGVRLMRLEPGTKLVSAQLLARPEADAQA